MENNVGGNAMRQTAAPQAATAGGSWSSHPGVAREVPSIRAYRARKLRPCDICRSRRKRCIIPRSGEPCTLCVSIDKPCTFLHDRQRKVSPSEERRRDKVHSETSRRSASPPARHAPAMGLGPRPGGSTESSRASISTPAPYPISNYSAAGPSMSQHVSGPRTAEWHSPDGPRMFASGSHPAISPLLTLPTPPSAASWLASRQPGSALDLIYRVRSLAREQPRQPDPQRSGSVSSHSHVTFGALDDDAGQDEELFLAGTASERDALILNNLTNPPAPGLRVRRVSPKITFVFYKSQPYGPEVRDDNDTAWSKLQRLIGPHLIVNIANRLLDVEGQGCPVFSPQQRQSLHNMPETLRCLVVAAGLIYTPSLRHLHHHAYVTTMRQFRSHAPNARLWTMQMYLLDLNGREAINPTGNFIVLGLAVSLARLLGLHEDCSDWTIPQWEKDLRCNLWWALLTYDKMCVSFNTSYYPLTHRPTVRRLPLAGFAPFTQRMRCLCLTSHRMQAHPWPLSSRYAN